MSKNGLINIYKEQLAIRLLKLVLPTINFGRMCKLLSLFRDSRLGRGRGGGAGGSYLKISKKGTGEEQVVAQLTPCL